MGKKLRIFINSILFKSKFKKNIYFRIPKVGVEWKKVDPYSKNLKFLYFESPDNIKMKQINNLGNRQFWESIGFNENKL